MIARILLDMGKDLLDINSDSELTMVTFVNGDKYWSGVGQKLDSSAPIWSHPEAYRQHVDKWIKLYVDKWIKLLAQAGSPDYLET